MSIECLTDTCHLTLYWANVCSESTSNDTRTIPAGIYLFKVDNGDIRTMCEICSNLIIKTPERRPGHYSGVFIVNFDQISHIVLSFPLLI